MARTPAPPRDDPFEFSRARRLRWVLVATPPPARRRVDTRIARLRARLCRSIHMNTYPAG